MRRSRGGYLRVEAKPLSRIVRASIRTSPTLDYFPGLPSLYIVLFLPISSLRNPPKLSRLSPSSTTISQNKRDLSRIDNTLAAWHTTTTALHNPRLQCVSALHLWGPPVCSGPLNSPTEIVSPNITRKISCPFPSIFSVLAKGLGQMEQSNVDCTAGYIRLLCNPLDFDCSSSFY